MWYFVVCRNSYVNMLNWLTRAKDAVLEAGDIAKEKVLAAKEFVDNEIGKKLETDVLQKYESNGKLVYIRRRIIGSFL